MIDRDVLRKLGWSDELIAAMNNAAEPMRQLAGVDEISAPIQQIEYVSGTAIYTDAVVDNTFRGFTVVDANKSVPKEEKKRKKRRA